MENRQIKILFDINCLPAEFKDMSLEEILNYYKDNFGVILVPYDTSRHNTFGDPNNNSIYTIL